MNDIVDRLAGKKIDFWTDPAKAEGVILQMPVYILTSRTTFSGAEDFTYGMQTVKRATVVGDTTGGGAHPVRSFSIGLGFVASIPFARSLNPYTLTDWEGTGVIPDIPVRQENALQTAIETILTQRMKNATTDEEKRRIQWLLNYNLSRPSARTAPQDSSSLARYTGIYQGGLNFYVRGNTLYCKNAERGNGVFRLLPVKDNLFVLDENVEVEFLPDAAGNFNRLKMLWSNGSETTKEKQDTTSERKQAGQRSAQ